jgi:thioredoxin 1
MKNSISLILLALCLIFLTSFKIGKKEPVLKRGIEFHKGSWNEALLDAKQQNKFIFVYFYAKWCGQCKKLKKSFKDKEVGDYFNKNFINIAVDGETKEGRQLMYLYQNQSYPTLLIVDSTGRVKTKTVGFLKPYILINFGRRIVP